jgi:hypothetical protein
VETHERNRAINITKCFALLIMTCVRLVKKLGLVVGEDKVDMVGQPAHHEDADHHTKHHHHLQQHVLSWIKSE